MGINFFVFESKGSGKVYVCVVKCMCVCSLPVTREKIRIERGEANVKAGLLELIEDAASPAEYGGGLESPQNK